MSERTLAVIAVWTGGLSLLTGIGQLAVGIAGLDSTGFPAALTAPYNSTSQPDSRYPEGAGVGLSLYFEPPVHIAHGMVVYYGGVVTR